ncbi:MAG TPA: cell division protein FtsA, partial [Verrucomicrobiae bacterium]|nr:cell division protein FtsA [Verrucomicrobiae bacterium]
MFNTKTVIVGLEVGTAKVCAVAAELNDDGAINIIGVGQAKSRGVRKGEIIDANVASEDVRNAIVEAEEMADVEIASVFLGVTGGHVRGFNNRGVYGLASADRPINKDDVEDALRNAKTVHLSGENHIIHLIRQHFIVDGKEGIQSAVGMFGSKVEVDVHVIRGNVKRLQSAIRAIKEIPLEVEDIAFNGMAASLAVLNHDQKELGALVIDFGAGTTEYVVYSGGIVRHAGVLAVGGDHISNDIAVGLRIPLGLAEQLKIDHGSAIVEDDAKGKTLNLPTEPTLPPRVINLEHLQRIMALRVQETIELIEHDLSEQGLLGRLRAGVFLCGGGARIKNLEQLAQDIFGLPASRGRTSAINGLRSALDQPEFATAIGLAKYGSFQ